MRFNGCGDLNNSFSPTKSSCHLSRAFYHTCGAKNEKYVIKMCLARVATMLQHVLQQLFHTCVATTVPHSVATTVPTTVLQQQQQQKCVTTIGI
jgi:hypothetical protein